jgi:hypothetical protein
VNLWLPKIQVLCQKLDLPHGATLQCHNRLQRSICVCAGERRRAERARAAQLNMLSQEDNLFSCVESGKLWCLPTLQRRSLIDECPSQMMCRWMMVESSRLDASEQLEASRCPSWTACHRCCFQTSLLPHASLARFPDNISSQQQDLVASVKVAVSGRYQYLPVSEEF